MDRYQTAFNALPDAAALDAASRRCALAEHKRADDGVWALTEDEIDAICLMRGGERTRREIDLEIKAHEKRTAAQADRVQRKQAYDQAATLAIVKKMIRQNLHEAAMGIAEGVGELVGPLRGRTAALEAHVGIERPTPPRPRVRGRHRGAWDRATTYKSGDAVVHLGELWLARVDGFAAAEPGVVTHDYWTPARSRED